MGQNNPERAFITLMFLGVWEQSMASRIWRATGGRLNDSYFRFKIGGEW